MSAGSGKNPFRPGVGIRPPYLAGRDAPMRRFDAMLRAAPEQPANMRVTGLRGVGKTVLLKEFEERSRSSGWVATTLELGPRHNTDTGIASAIRMIAETTKLKVSKWERIKAATGAAIRSVGRLGVTWNDMTFSLVAGTDSIEEDIAKRLFEITEFVVEKEHAGLIVLLDEAQVVRDEKDREGAHPLSSLITSLVALQKQEIPVGLVLCGVPTLTGNLLKARSYTERMFRGEEIGSLATAEAREALMEPLKGGAISATPDVVDTVVRDVEGYPYFVQLWGAELWDAAQATGSPMITSELLRATEPDIYRRLDSDFYEPRIATLTPAEQDLLLATAESKTYPPLLVSEIDAVSDKSYGNINVLLGRMVEAGVLYRIRKGQYDYTAPKFREFLERRSQKMV
jgi:hypothetical protein